MGGGGKAERRRFGGENKVGAGSGAGAGIKPQCVECGKMTPAYKCPTCREKYCSADCCAEHKKKCGVEVSSSKPVMAEVAVLGVGVIDLEGTPGTLEEPVEEEKEDTQTDRQFPTEDTVPPEKLYEIRDDERIKELLKSPKLRDLITKLDTMPNPLSFFRQTMEQPEFRAFSNVVLEIVGVKQDYHL